MKEKCSGCGETLEIGSWPFCPHGKPTPSKGYEAHFDHGLGAYVTTPGDKKKLLRPHWEDDHIVHLQPRDEPASYYRELNDRRRERASKGQR